MDVTVWTGDILPINYPTEAVILSYEKRRGDYDYLLINFTTLVRNFITALNPVEDISEKSKWKKEILTGNRYKDKIKNLFIKDLEIFLNILNDKHLKVKFYYRKDIDHKKIKKCYNNYKLLEELNFNNQISEEYAKSFVRYVTDEAVVKIEPLPQPDPSVNYLILTHNSIDLIRFQYKKYVNLIESFTGDIKPYTLWYTKLSKFGDHDLSIIPFNYITLAIFGCNNYVKPGKIKLKKHIYGIAKKMKWTSSTTLSKVKLDLEIKDPMLYKLLNEQIGKCYKNI